MKLYSFCILFFVTLCFSACTDSAVVSEFEDLDKEGWAIDSAKVFQFVVEDENQAYDLYYHVRNEIDYPFYNLYVKYELKDGEGKTLNSKMSEVLLMDEKTGRPFGSGGGGVYDHEVLVLSDYSFPKSGDYSFSLRQYMRRDTLPNIQAIGFSLKKAKNKNE
ncbi:gliding motility lipoprotein GldH [Flammeovirgaceae bacterium SG7u.111]|nr:gliding motility lipoprotein GldH [Flammeovirgaceae bacterium SG7u.132]WPO35699.1 gliding motility lipoprotein GldH [Flammeovirgaceae bacterium SG7u.111]